jgi:O-antigen ligase
LAARTHAWRPAAGPLVLALAVPLIFIHATYQPSVSVDLGSTSATLYLSDAAVLVAAAAGLVEGLRRGFWPLRAGLPVQLAGGAFLAWILAATVYPLAYEDHYRVAVHLVTALKLCEYAFLSLAVPLVLRRRDDALPLFATLTAWSVAASTGAVLQFLGLVNEFEGRRPGQREPSFLGIHDLAALSGGVLGLALAAIALGPLPRRQRQVAVVAGVSGAVGLALSGAVAGVAGLAAAAGAAALLAWLRRVLDLRRLVLLALPVVLVAAGVFALRSANIDSFLRFVGVRTAEEAPNLHGDSYSQRSVLAYIGGRIFLAHPVLGVGWQGTSEEESYGPFLDDAHRKFPAVPELSFPAPEHPWGIQNAYIQAGAELGVVGLAAFLALFGTAFAVALRATLRARRDEAAAAAVPILLLLMTMGVWLGLGLIAGTPLVGLQWLALGLAAAAATWTAHERA